MSDMRVNGIGNGAELFSSKVVQKEAGGSFDEFLQDAMGKVSQVQDDARQAVKEVVTGGDITQAMIAMEKADMSFQLMVEVRNRLLSAYDEITRMNV